MPEVQQSTNSGEQAVRFIELVVMQAQQAKFFLGLVPHPQTGQSTVNLELAKKFIGFLEMLRYKTRTNLDEEEQRILDETLAQLHAAYQKAGGQI